MVIEKILKSIWNEFIYGGHLLSLGAVGIVFTSAILLEIRITWDCLAVIYLSVQSAYLYNRYREFKKDYLTNFERTQYLEKKIAIIPLIVFFFTVLFTIILLYFSKLSVLVFGFLLLLLGLLYSKFFKSFTKKIIGFKNFYVSFAWSLLIIFLVFYYSAQLTLSFYFVFVFVYFRLFIHEAFFDIKDIESDKKEKLLTFSIVLGKEKLINVLNIINVFSIVPIILGVYLNIFPSYSLILFLTLIYTFYYLRKVKDTHSNQSFLYNVVSDGEFILWIIFIFLGKILL